MEDIMATSTQSCSSIFSLFDLALESFCGDLQVTSTRSGSFPFLKLPGELRNQIYELLLMKNRHFNGVILINDLNRRSEARGTCRINLRRNELSSQVSKNLALKHCMQNDGIMTRRRIDESIWRDSSVFETNILRVCRQTYIEGSGIIWEKNVFAVTVPATSRDSDILWYLPQRLDVSKIQRLRLEIQVNGYPYGLISIQNRHTIPSWAFLRSMRELKQLQVVVTFYQRYETDRDYFHRFWHGTRYYTQLMQEFIAAVPKSVDIQMGLTKRDKELEDYSGWYPVKNCVLRKILRLYGSLQGVDVEIISGETRQVDGDDDDSDLEIEEALD